MAPSSNVPFVVYVSDMCTYCDHGTLQTPGTMAAGRLRLEHSVRGGACREVFCLSFNECSLVIVVQGVAVT